MAPGGWAISGIAIIAARSDLAGDAAGPQAQQLHQQARIITATARDTDHVPGAYARQAEAVTPASDSALAA